MSQTAFNFLVLLSMSIHIYGFINNKMLEFWKNFSLWIPTIKTMHKL
jgi:hypothetical protein